jgi:type IV pilus assembly protein PilN
MITINLKPGVKRAKPGASVLERLSGLKDLPGKVKDPWPMAAVAVWVALLAFLAWVGIGSVTTLHRVETEMVKVRADNLNLEHLIADRRKAQAARDSVLTQIATIRNVDGDRYVWPHIMDEVTRALPPYTWLTEMSTMAVAVTDSSPTAPAPVGVQLIGRTMDIQGFTRFMRQLEDSDWLSDVTLISTSTEIDHGRAVTVFTVKASYARMPKSKPAAAASGEN